MENKEDDAQRLFRSSGLHKVGQLDVAVLIQQP